MPFPTVSPELLAALEDAFPLRSPRIEESDRIIWRDVGTRRVVDFLREKHAEQQNNFLATPEADYVPK